MFFKKIKNKLGLLNLIYLDVKKAQSTLTKLQESIGRLQLRQLEYLGNTEINQNEFQVFSQWGEDGIIQMLLRHIKIANKIFIEFGVENYTESNTRFLLVNNNWAGLVIDGSHEHISYIKQDSIYWRHNLKAVQAFIDRDNINKIIAENGIQGEIGILSIDIDGNDYWVWEAIDVVNPAIVIIEYNSRFGKDKAVTIPYNPSFIRSQAHYSMLYAGASLKALYNLGKAKGYSFVGCNSVGNNAFFVRQDLKSSNIRELTLEEGYVASQFRESRDEKGNLSYLSWDEGNQILSSLPLVDLE
ncbi:hypothetical protein [Umezakia ovalisporum]|uniref:Uncharacterized protein n=1 Tax=Umezakia ovalisporum FSS-62 TaxID=2971776 RepID=A0AA43GYM9_9CYAN|nr:hypothetical protein [Umezakia ovalisporum]MDH6063303.1 hypothetical protein [Umezakia ovalisporum FSS-62]